MKSRTCTALVLTALIVLALVPAANAAIDYSQNAAGGEYAPAVTPSVAAPPASTDSGFDWGAAAIGAGAALIVIVTASGLRSGVGVMRSRREPA